MKTFMVSHFNAVWDMLRQSISHKKWWRVIITRQKIGKNSAGLLSAALTHHPPRRYILGQKISLRKTGVNVLENLR